MERCATCQFFTLDKPMAVRGRCAVVSNHVHTGWGPTGGGNPVVLRPRKDFGCGTARAENGDPMTDRKQPTGPEVLTAEMAREALAKLERGFDGSHRVLRAFISANDPDSYERRLMAAQARCHATQEASWGCSCYRSPCVVCDATEAAFDALRAIEAEPEATP